MHHVHVDELIHCDVLPPEPDWLVLQREGLEPRPTFPVNALKSLQYAMHDIVDSATRLYTAGVHLEPQSTFLKRGFAAAVYGPSLCPDSWTPPRSLERVARQKPQAAHGSANMDMTAL
jgi:hypothetical protein